MSAKKRKKQSAFRFGLKVYCSLLVFVFGVAVTVLWVVLSRHQTTVDAEAAQAAERERQAAYELSVQRAPQLALEDYLAKTDAQSWLDAWLLDHDATYEDPDQLLALMGERFSAPEVSCWKARDCTEEAPCYVLKNGAETLARLTLSGSGLDWSVSGVQVLLEGENEASLTVPEGYTVRCNGLPLESSGEPLTRLYDMADYADKIVEPARWYSYSVSGLLTEPVLVAEAPEGSLTDTLEDGTVFYILPADEAATYQKRAESFIYDLLSYYMLGNSNTWGNMWEALDHVMNGSQAYQLIRDSYDGVTWDTCYNNRSYYARAGEVRILADNCLMVDVLYHAEGHYDGHTNLADGTYRVYFLNLGWGYGIFGLAYV